MFDDVKKELEDKFETVAQCASDLNKALHEFRSIKCDFDKDNAEEVQQAMTIGHELDSRTNYILRAILIQHGNVLFL